MGLPLNESQVPGSTRTGETLQWFLRVRWAVVVILVAGGAVALLAGATSVEGYASGLIAAAAVSAYNLAFTLLLRRAPAGRAGAARRELVRWAQQPADIIGITLLLHILGTGGISPLIILYGAVVLGGVILLPPRGIYMVTAFAIGCYGLLLGYEFFVRPLATTTGLLYDLRTPPNDPGAVALATFFALAAGLSATAFVSSRFAARLHDNEILIRQQLADLTIVHDLARDLAATLDVDEVLQKVTDRTQVLLGADTVSVVLLRPDGKAEFHMTSGMDPAAIATWPHVPLPDDHPMLARLRGGTPILAPDVGALPGLRALLVRPQTASFYSFPLVVEHGTIGALNFSFDQPQTLLPASQAMLTAVANQAALALARARLYQAATHAALEMASLYRIGLATSSSLQIDEVLMQIYQQVQGVLAPAAFFVALHDPDNQELHFELVVERGQVLPLHGVPLDQDNITAWVARTRQPLLIRHRSQEQAQLPQPVLHYGLENESLVILPLLAKDRVIGVLSAQRPEPEAFNEDDVRLLTAMAAQAALALENARLHAEMRERALRDSLTGVYNHGALIERLTRALSTAEGHSVALIMLDVDHFKTFNDRWGHQAGDAALQALAQAMRAVIKRSDTVGRWGGEEFAVILPGAGPAEARSVAIRIRDHLAAVILTGPNSQTWPSPTVSQGIATFPAGADSPPTLVAAADQALYEAKAQGRNSIVVSRHPACLDTTPSDAVR